MNNILITGGNGQVGYELKRKLAVFGVVDSPSRQCLDLENLEEVATYLEAKKPSLIVNAAAWTAVDSAENETVKALALNKALPSVLAEYAAKHNIWLIHYSSDYVYPGDGTTPWKETDTAGPLSAYGKSKLQGDECVLSSGCRHLIFRTSWVYSSRGNNFLKTMLKLAQVRESLNVVNDQYGAPTPAKLIADVTAIAVDKISQTAEPASGIYHLATSGVTNWHEFASSIFSLVRAKGVELNVKDVVSIPTADYPTPAKRPLNSRLALGKIEDAFGIKMPHWYSQLQLTIEDYLINQKD